MFNCYDFPVHRQLHQCSNKYTARHQMWSSKLFWTLVSLCLFVVRPVYALKELHIGSMFPMEAGSGGWAGGQACLPAVQMALDDINNNPNVLPGYHLHSHNHNTKCQPGLAAKQLYELLYKPPVKLMLVSGCSPVTTVVAEAAPVWNLIVLSYGASSPALSNRERFPTLFRTHPSANMQNPTRIRLFEKFKWSKITILQSVEEVFTSTAKDLEEQCRERGMRVERQSFYGDPRDAIKTLVRQDARIIVGLYYVTEARRVLCQAYKHGLYGKKYVWFLIGWYADTWYIPPKDEHINCTAEQMKEAAQYHFTTESIMLSRDNRPAISGMTGRDFQKRLNKMINSDPANTGGYPEAPLAYDAVWALALAFNCTQNSLPFGVMLEDFSYNNAVIADQLFDCVKNTQFKGVSGQVMFSDSGDRIARSQIEQMQDGKYVVVGYYDTTTQSFDWNGKEKFVDDKPPPDATVVRESLMTVRFELYVFVAVVAVTGMLVTIASAIFNYKLAYRGIIIQSQPQCNGVLIVGCALCLLSLLLMGMPVEGLYISPDSFLCHSRLTLLMFGFTFAYGSMFAKVWVMHRMGASENQELAAIAKDEEDGSPWESIRMLLGALVGRQVLVAAALRKISSHAYTSLIARRPCLLNQPIPSAKFYSVIAALFGADVVILVFWILLDPLQKKRQKFMLQEPSSGMNEDVMYLPVLEYCESNHQEIWTALILGYKCLLLVFGLFLAYESRNLKIRFINDSRFVCMAIYNVAIVALVTGPVVSLLLRSQPNANFTFTSITVSICVYISLGLVFVPKALYIYRTPASKEDAMTGNSNPRNTVSRSEQLRYEQLVKENVELKRQIETRESRIIDCRKALEKRLGTATVAPANCQLINQCVSIDKSNHKCVETVVSTTSQVTVNSVSNNNIANNVQTNNNNVSSSLVSEEQPTQSTIFTTTALIENHAATTDAGICSDFDEDSDDSSSSNEILL
ncbi:Gamma-aminobutyric acid type B receptor subunit 1 [Aphelenchoides besseyi]|nr:Gamma-aminobutyric acid type B receptor subunit 1 [Aphelenchoides besseyi]